MSLPALIWLKKNPIKSTIKSFLKEKTLNTSPKNILIIRFSAMGDVVLTVPVIRSLQDQYPDVEITLLTNSFLHPFFEGIPHLYLPKVDLKGKHKGIKGLYRLVQELTATHSYDAILDLHDVIRSRIISSFMRFKSVPIYRINKGRAEKKNFIQKKQHKPLPHTTERYKLVFHKAGFVFTMQRHFLHVADVEHSLLETKSVKIGIAPFAAHKSKQWSLEKIQDLIKEINRKYDVTFYLFGGGKSEKIRLEALADNFKNVHNLVGLYTLSEELQIIKNLDVMLAMDSGNMHIASLLGIPVISIWGGTHPDIGFSALYQPVENSIQIPLETLPCRPCSVYGTNTCKLKEIPFACMEQIQGNSVIQRLEEIGVLA